jgi:hypothetical protein
MDEALEMLNDVSVQPDCDTRLPGIWSHHRTSEGFSSTDMVFTRSCCFYAFDVDGETFLFVQAPRNPTGIMSVILAVKRHAARHDHETAR